MTYFYVVLFEPSISRFPFFRRTFSQWGLHRFEYNFSTRVSTTKETVYLPRNQRTTRKGTSYIKGKVETSTSIGQPSITSGILPAFCSLTFWQAHVMHTTRGSIAYGTSLENSAIYALGSLKCRFWALCSWKINGSIAILNRLNGLLTSKFRNHIKPGWIEGKCIHTLA